MYRIFFESKLQVEGLEEYVEERSPLNEQNNFEREPVKQDITNNSS